MIAFEKDKHTKIYMDDNDYEYVKNMPLNKRMKYNNMSPIVFSLILIALPFSIFFKGSIFIAVALIAYFVATYPNYTKIQKYNHIQKCITNANEIKKEKYGEIYNEAVRRANIRVDNDYFVLIECMNETNDRFDLNYNDSAYASIYWNKIYQSHVSRLINMYKTDTYAIERFGEQDDRREFWSTILDDEFENKLLNRSLKHVESFSEEATAYINEWFNNIKEKKEEYHKRNSCHIWLGDN